MLGKTIQFSEENYQGDYIIDFAKELSDSKGKTLLDQDEETSISYCAQFAAERIIAQIRQDLTNFGIEFDNWFSEQSLYDSGKVGAAIDNFRDKNIIYENNNAKIINKDNGTIIENVHITKNYFVVRAEDTEGWDSEDSNEIWISTDLRVPPDPVIDAGVYNDTTKTIDISWSQVSSTLVTKWKIYSSKDQQGGPYTDTGVELVNDGSTDFSASWTVPGDGTYYLVVVGFRDGSSVLNADSTQLTLIDAANTNDSNEVQVSVRVHPAPAKNFKVKIWVQ